MSEELDRDTQRVQQAIDMLCEHFETTHIFVTRETEENEKQTIAIHLGSGNWYARYGQIKEWIVRQEEAARIDKRKDEE